MENGRNGETGTDAVKVHTKGPSAVQEKLDHRLVGGLVRSQTLVGNHVMVALLNTGIAMTLRTRQKRLVKVSLRSTVYKITLILLVCHELTFHFHNLIDTGVILCV